MLAKEYLDELLLAVQQAQKILNMPEDQITEIEIQKVLGQLDIVEHEGLAAKCLLREEMKERRSI